MNFYCSWNDYFDECFSGYETIYKRGERLAQCLKEGLTDHTLKIFKQRSHRRVAVCDSLPQIYGNDSVFISLENEAAYHKDASEI